MDMQYSLSLVFITFINLTILQIVESGTENPGISQDDAEFNISPTKNTFQRTTSTKPSGPDEEPYHGAPLMNTGLVVGGVMIGLIIFLLIVIIIIRKRHHKWKRKAHETEKFEAAESEEFVHTSSRRSSRASRRHSEHSTLEP